MLAQLTSDPGFSGLWSADLGVLQASVKSRLRAADRFTVSLLGISPLKEAALHSHQIQASKACLQALLPLCHRSVPVRLAARLSSCDASVPLQEAPHENKRAAAHGGTAARQSTEALAGWTRLACDVCCMLLLQELIP